MKSTILMAIILALVPTSLASGQFALDSLPKPGQWAKYALTTTGASWQDEKLEWSYHLRCLADDSSQEPTCVWIEFEINTGNGETLFYKLMMPKSEFRPGGNPMEHLVKGWKFCNPGTSNDIDLRKRWADRKPKPITIDQIEDLDHYLIVIPPDNAEQLMSDYFEVNGETIRCKGLVFTHRWSEEDNVEWASEIETRVSHETLFGLVVADWSSTTFNDGKEVEKYMTKTVLVASGDDAVSAIPDVKQARANVAESRRD